MYIHTAVLFVYYCLESVVVNISTEKKSQKSQWLSKYNSVYKPWNQ